MSSLFNPGKRGILTLLSVILIIGIPGIIAYADDSTDTYYSATSIEPPVKLEVTNSGTTSSFGLTVVDSEDDGYSVSVDSVASDESTALSSLTSVSSYKLVLDSTDMSSEPVKVVFDSTIDCSSVKLLISYSGTFVSYQMVYDSESEVWEYEISSLEAASHSEITYASFVITPSETTSAVSEFDVCYSFAVKESIFTDDVVELLVLVGGIALLIIGTFSLSFIDLDTPGKAANSFIRGAKSAGRKVSSYAKGRGKK